MDTTDWSCRNNPNGILDLGCGCVTTYVPGQVEGKKKGRPAEDRPRDRQIDGWMSGWIDGWREVDSFYLEMEI